MKKCIQTTNIRCILKFLTKVIFNEGYQYQIYVGHLFLFLHPNNNCNAHRQLSNLCSLQILYCHRKP